MRRSLVPLVLVIGLLAVTMFAPGLSTPIADAQSDAVVRIVITADKGPGDDGWLEFDDGRKQWLFPDCRATLEADGVPVAVLPWAEIEAMPDAPQLDCASLRPEADGATEPVAVVESPVGGAVVSAPVVISGSAFDDVGVERVRLRIVEVGSGATWDGSGFTAKSSSVVADVVGLGGSSVAWSYEFGGVVDVEVKVKAIAHDTEDTRRSSGWTYFTVDGSTEPVAVVESPVGGAVVSAPVVISGSAFDDVGVERVRLRIVEVGSGATWDGSGFTAKSSSVVADVVGLGGSSVAWSYEFGGVVDVEVKVKAIAHDTEDTRRSSGWTYFTVDGSTEPVAVVESPVGGAVVSAPVVISGSAFDDVGVERVRLRIVEVGSGATWDGSGFTAKSSSVVADVVGLGGSSVAWSYEFGGVVDVEVKVKAIAHDTEDTRRSSGWTYFTVDEVTDPAAANLALILTNPGRNTSFDDNPFRGVPADQIDVSDLTVNRDIYNEGLLDTSNSGYFRVKCEVSHFAYDDPIVHPNQPGRAHLHMFFGNTEANAYSTFDSLLNSGTGTCNGEDLNRTAYWVPAMLDSDGNALIPFEVMVYYKNDNFRLGGANELVEPFPDNLRMIAGNAGATSPQTTLTGPPGTLPVISFSCGPAYNSNHLRQALIPDCYGTGEGPYQGRALEMQIAFPQCLAQNDGTYLADQSHSSYSDGGYYAPRCPASHPVDISSVMYRIFFSPDDYGGSLTDLHLSSDVKPSGILPGGTTAHADWFGAWHPEAMDMWVENCNNTQADCETGLLDRSPAVSLVLRDRGFYPPGHTVSAEDLIQLCPGKSFDESEPLRSVANCRHH